MTCKDRILEKAKKLRDETAAIALAFSDGRTPLIAKIFIGVTVSYAVSPIDLIPDFIPVLGYLDDVILLPILISISIRLIPPAVLNDCRSRVKENHRINKNIGFLAATIIILFWLGLSGLLLILIL